jgi:hypothetical protein
MNLSVDWNSVFVPAMDLQRSLFAAASCISGFRDPPLHGATSGGTFRAC